MLYVFDTENALHYENEAIRVDVTLSEHLPIQKDAKSEARARNTDGPILITVRYYPASVQPISPRPRYQ